MEKKERLGGIVAILGGLMGLIGHALIFMNWYDIACNAQAAEPGCEMLLKYIMPALNDVGVLGGVFYIISAYGFFSKAKWALPMLITANVFALQGAWFVNVPFMAAGMPPIYFIVFWPNLILYFVITRVVGGYSWGRILVGLVAGMAFILCLMNGIASWSRIITIGAPIFVAVQRLHWIATIGMGVVTIGMLTRPKNWMRILGITAAFIELIVGIPLGIITSIELERFSLFSIAPILSFIILVMFLSVPYWKRITGGDEDLEMLNEPLSETT